MLARYCIGATELPQTPRGLRDLFDRVRDVACQIDRVGNDPLGVRRSRKQQAAHEAEDKFVFHEDWGDKGNEEIK